MPSFISICIPAYKHVDHLERLLRSIAEQAFKDFEVIVTDDSPGENLKEICNQYQSAFTLHYFKNEPALGSPENWNAGIKRAKGQWIKMMHDDDWFANTGSLQKFAQAAMQHPDSDFIFSGFREVDLSKKTVHEFIINDFYMKLLKNSPLILCIAKLI